MHVDDLKKTDYILVHYLSLHVNIIMRLTHLHRHKAKHSFVKVGEVGIVKVYTTLILIYSENMVTIMKHKDLLPPLVLYHHDTSRSTFLKHVLTSLVSFAECSTNSRATSS